MAASLLETQKWVRARSAARAAGYPEERARAAYRGARARGSRAHTPRRHLPAPPRAGKVHGSLARAGKVRGQTPKVAKAADKPKKKAGRARKRIVYNRRFVNVVVGLGKKKGPNSNMK